MYYSLKWFSIGKSLDRLNKTKAIVQSYCSLNGFSIQSSTVLADSTASVMQAALK